MPGSRQGTDLLPVVGERLCRCVGEVRGVDAITERYEHGETLAGQPFAVPLIRERGELGERVCAPREGELPVDGDEGHGKHDPTERGPEPLRSWPDERHPLGVDQHHDRSSHPDDTMGGR